MAAGPALGRSRGGSEGRHLLRLRAGARSGWRREARGAAGLAPRPVAGPAPAFRAVSLHGGGPRLAALRISAEARPGLSAPLLHPVSSAASFLRCAVRSAGYPEAPILQRLLSMIVSVPWVIEKCLTLGAKKIFYIPADMCSPSEPERVVQFAVQKLGGLDYLVLNHIGMTCFQMWAGNVEYTHWLMQVNFFSYVALATAALPTLEKNKGSLVIVSSLTGKIPTPFTTSYSATKFALDGFFSSLRHELIMQKRNVSITLCILGLIDTDTALENTRGKVHLTASPAPEAALAIIQGSATRVQEVFYPWWLQHICCLWVLSPSDRDQVLQSYYNYSSP
ncbi:hydroxysteroid 11-beta-dehydrogenase 1-like protein isoform X1 [Balearica regulorum gibbericeps]|uniref:hydroxysteroid 11-beta-dehydrogenase 1-like protein isoform X1 n=1 Tax=Balearica regulorum gibbericeps TaxID=100784 RepID=UPI003F61565A